jgi:hypothetical protein
VLNGLELAHDLAALARGDDPPALMARQLLILRQPGEERSALLEATRETLQTQASEARWTALGGERDAQDPLSDAAVTALLERSGTAALSELLSQRDRDAEAGAEA